MAHQFDLFHFKRELHRLLRYHETRCYELMETVEQARRWVDEPRLLSSARIQAILEHREKAAHLDRKLEAFDWTETILAYLEEQFTAYDSRRRRLRSFPEAQAVVDEVLELLAEVTAINVQPIRSLISGARAGLCTFLSILDRKLDRIPVTWRRTPGNRRALWDACARVWYGRQRAHRSPAQH